LSEGSSEVLEFVLKWSISLGIQLLSFDASSRIFANTSYYRLSCSLDYKSLGKKEWIRVAIEVFVSGFGLVLENLLA
jgi:hypothetical protein